MNRQAREREASANVIVSQLLFLAAQDPNRDVQLYINSSGGSVSAGFAIYDTMRFIPCGVSTICVGLAASFGAFLLAGGTKGKRLALPNAKIMIRSRQNLKRILAENTGKPVEEVARDTERDYYMTAKEAAEYGMIDRVITKR